MSLHHFETLANKAVDIDKIDVAVPCPVDWNTMSGDDKIRFCGQCGKQVHNLSAMKREEAEALIAEDENRCVRFYRGEEGIVWTTAQVEAPPVSRRGWLRAVAALSLTLRPSAARGRSKDRSVSIKDLEFTPPKPKTERILPSFAGDSGPTLLPQRVAPQTPPTSRPSATAPRVGGTVTRMTDLFGGRPVTTMKTILEQKYPLDARARLMSPPRNEGWIGGIIVRPSSHLQAPADEQPQLIRAHGGGHLKTD